MLEFARNWKGIVTAAVLGAAIIGATASPASAQEKKREYKDTAEYELINAVTIDINSNNFPKAITDLETWKQKYPASDYSDVRDVYFIQAYSGAKQCNKVLALAGDLLSQDLNKVYGDAQGPRNQMTILFSTAVCITQVPNPSPKELEIGGKAGKELADFNRKPEGVTDAQWNDARKSLLAAANAAMLTVAVVPGNQALAKQPPDCDTAARVFSGALVTYPNNTFISYGLGRAWYCLARANNQEKVKEYLPKAVYEFVRSIAIDPTLGGTQQDTKALISSVTNIYSNYHGAVDGLEDLKTKSKEAALPPEGFTIASAYDVAIAKQKEFEEKYPELAFWLKIKTPLTAPDGETYFQSSVKDTLLPTALKGRLVEGVPACRSKSLLVSFPEPGQTGEAPTVVTLKLDSALTGKPDLGVEIEFKGIPSAFTQEPFMLTFDTEKAEIKGLQTTPCTTAPARAPAKKGVTKKK